MKKLYLWMLAAILVCGASLFTSCSKDDSESAKEQTEAELNRDKFIEHTRATVKELAENMNFTSWETANNYDLYFNQYVLNNPEFENAVLYTFMSEVAETAKAVEEGSALAELGFGSYVTVDLTNFNYRFTMNAENTGFDVEPAEDFEILLNGYNPQTKQLEQGLYKVTWKTSGTTLTRVLPVPNVKGMAMVLNLGTEFQFALSSKISGSWNDDFTGIMHYQVPDGATDGSKGFTADAVIKSNILAGTVGDKSDKTQLNLSISSDRVNGKATGQCSWTHNDRKILDLSVKESGAYMGIISNLDRSQYTSSASIFTMIASVLGSRSIDEAKLTLLDDLTVTFSVSNLLQLLQVESEYRTDGRNYADKETIDKYTEKMNELVKAEIYCKGTNQTLPMRLATKKVGIDYWSLYEVKFSEDEYISLLGMLDRQAFTYYLNIMDHSVDYMQQSVIVARQLMQFVQAFNGMFAESGQTMVNR